MRTRITVVGFILLLAVTLHLSAAEETGPTYLRNAMCLACHKSTHKELVERYLTTKHAQATLTAEMKPVDIYRRSVGFKSADNSYFEAGVGCQTCHGPGSAHMKGRTPEEKRAAIVMPTELKTQAQKLSVCGRCHGDYTVDGKPFAEGLKPGEDLFALPTFKLNAVTTPGPFQQLNDFMGSKHATHDVTCLTCHTSHEAFGGKPQLRKAVPDLCLDCHKDVHKDMAADKLAACATCHMPGGRHLFKTVK
jgi:predicted CXXCH cytochrome family protein